ncbi:MAG TPA: hypothetical protein VFP00_07510, partial [Burkholderiales bacterium]|nr:hypothetical protein [Burkholderiales bacterium]
MYPTSECGAPSLAKYQRKARFQAEKLESAMNTASIRTRLSLLIVLSALPAFVVSVYSGFERYRHADATARDRMMKTAALAAASLESGMALGSAQVKAAQDIVARIPAPEGGRLVVVGGDGAILASEPAVSKGATVRNFPAIEKEGLNKPFVADDEAGTRRLYAVRAVRGSPESAAPLYVVASAPARIAL